MPSKRWVADAADDVWTYITDTGTSVRRTQIYLSEAEADALEQMARRTGQSRSELIRRAIEDVYVETRLLRNAEHALLRSVAAWGSGESGRAFVDRIRK